MTKLKIKDLKTAYNGRCKIIPCCDLAKLEDSFDDLKSEICEAVRDQQIISNWTLREDALQKFDEEDFENDTEKEEAFWSEFVCQVLNSGFLIIYEVPVPSEVKKVDGRVSSYSFSWGYYQTYFIHLENISELTAILSNLDDCIVEDVYKKEQGEKK